MVDSHITEDTTDTVVAYRKADSVLVIDEGRLAELIADFFSDKTAATQRAYKKDLKDFANFLDQESIQDASKYLLQHGQGAANWTSLRYRKDLVLRGLAPATINRRLASLRSLVDFAKHVGMIPWDISIKSVKHRKYRDTAGPGKASIEKMFRFLGTQRSPWRERNRAVFGLLFFQGLRRTEIVRLELNDFDRERNMLFVLGKGRSEKELRKINDGVLSHILGEWIEFRGNDPGPLIQSISAKGKLGGSLSDHGIWRIVHKTGLSLGIKVWPHAMRHSCITQLCETAIQAGLTLKDVQEFARHSNIATTMLYWDRTHSNQGKVGSLLEGAIAI